MKKDKNDIYAGLVAEKGFLVEKTIPIRHNQPAFLSNPILIFNL
jgi:hypothetical protein